MDQLKFRLLRAHVLHELVDFVPKGHYKNIINDGQLWNADLTIGKLESLTIPTMTARQMAACSVLRECAEYQLNKWALFRK
jgi:hypothetical protein